ncbi:ABC transporter substrate-binding protein [Allorhizobium sp. BGMRC 0089]|uniref:ABC transporter substrate-binding protein n=1 Tax=Allorhizobium sonneratiae TaxID=2934936 RepID=UPI00203408E3|nr:ABC transporter substrate-binding protein [Allorhizobium sonneratiae]MCM2293171.1 ABC transporter substrate-binding protein [Allorhizobium sonneratiae]
MKQKMASLLLGASLALAGVSAEAADKITLQLKWVTQAQFAGYFVAKDKGYYKAEGLDVDIKPGGPNIAPEQIIAGGGADVIVDWMGAALAAREKGVPLVNIAQPYAKAGLEIICPKDGPIKTLADFKGHTIGVWFYGNEVPFFALMHREGISTDGGPNGVKVLQQSFDVQPLIQHQADCIHVMTYNELGQAIDAGYTLDKLTVFNYTKMNANLLEDGLYVLQDKLKDPKFKADMVKFVRASMKGWNYAKEHPDEAADIVLDNDTTGAQTKEHQEYMMHEVAKLLGNGVLDKAAYDRTEEAVLAQKIISKKPEGAWTHDITDAAMK